MNKDYDKLVKKTIRQNINTYWVGCFFKCDFELEYLKRNPSTSQHSSDNNSDNDINQKTIDELRTIDKETDIEMEHINNI